MSQTILHEHTPIFRVIRRDWGDPVDASFSQRPGVDNRWNTVKFPALYCCCSEAVARAIVNYVFRLTGTELADLQEAAQPQLTEIDWHGEPTDMVTEAAILAAGFRGSYPGHSDLETQKAAVRWYEEGASGVLCRSDSRYRQGFGDWTGDHARWSELAIFADRTSSRPSLIRRRDDLDWLSAY